MATNRGTPSPPRLTHAVQIWLVVTVLTVLAIAALLGVAAFSAAYLPSKIFYVVVVLIAAALAVGVGAIARWLVNP